MENQKIVSSWVEVSNKALEHNIALYKSIIGNTKLAIIVKSNAYGCDLALVAQLLDGNDQVDYLCAVSLAEAVYLRKLGIQKKILVLGIIDSELELVLDCDLEFAVYDFETILALNKLGELYRKAVNIHVKIDTGMSRLGFLPEQILDLIKNIKTLKFIKIQGLFTHYAASDRSDLIYVERQAAVFNKIVEVFEQNGLNIALKHTANTAAITASMATHFEMVRVGIGVYGLWPSPENQAITQGKYPGFNLKLVFSWKTKIISIKQLPAGKYVGYDLVYQTSKPTKVAMISVGYYDGYDRRLSAGGKVLINNKLAPVIGNIAMNITIIDITGIEAIVGDEVVLMGPQAGVHPDDLAQICKTASTELCARINPLIIRKLVS